MAAGAGMVEVVAWAALASVHGGLPLTPQSRDP